jgi:hypothetical protein
MGGHAGGAGDKDALGSHGGSQQQKQSRQFNSPGQCADYPCRREFIRETIANKGQCSDTHQMPVNAGSRERGKAALCFIREAFSALKDYRE